jgi:hypothetical protein
MIKSTMTAEQRAAYSAAMQSNQNEFDMLRDCNIKLYALKTKQYRFVAWLVFSEKNNCFICGIDTYSNDETNLQMVILSAADTSPIEAISTIYGQVKKWYGEGEIPLSEISPII